MNFESLKNKINNWVIKVRFCFDAIMKNPTEIYLEKKMAFILFASSSLIIFIYFYEIGSLNAIFLALMISLMVIFYIYTIFDIIFYSTFYDTLKYIKILSEGKPDRETLEKFQINFNKLRILFKKRLKLLNKNLLIYDYKINNIIKNIDVFFDTTIQIFFEKGIMNIPSTPYEEYERFWVNQKNEEIMEEEPPERINLEYRIIDYESITKFLDSFRKNFINSSMPPMINLYAIEEFFKRWNLVLQINENKIFVETEKNVIEYYDKIERLNTQKDKQRARIIETIITSTFAFIIAIAISYSLYKIFGFT